jgi:hypothetical protein
MYLSVLLPIFVFLVLRDSCRVTGLVATRLKVNSLPKHVGPLWCVDHCVRNLGS